MNKFLGHFHLKYHFKQRLLSRHSLIPTRDSGVKTRPVRCTLFLQVCIHGILFFIKAFELVGQTFRYAGVNPCPASRGKVSNLVEGIYATFLHQSRLVMTRNSLLYIPDGEATVFWPGKGHRLPRRWRGTAKSRLQLFSEDWGLKVIHRPH